MPVADDDEIDEIGFADEFMSDPFHVGLGKIFAKYSSLEGKVGELIKRCKAILPHPDWDRIAALDWRGEPKRIANWTRRELAHPLVDGPYVSLYYALNNPIIDDRPTTDVDLVIFFPAGARHDALDGLGGPAGSRVLNGLYEIAYTGKGCLGNNAEYTIGLAWSCFVVPDAIRLMSPKALFRHRVKKLEFTAGFHDGTIFDLGTAFAPKGPKGRPRFDFSPTPPKPR